MTSVRLTDYDVLIDQYTPAVLVATRFSSLNMHKSSRPTNPPVNVVCMQRIERQTTHENDESKDKKETNHLSQYIMKGSCDASHSKSHRDERLCDQPDGGVPIVYAFFYSVNVPLFARRTGEKWKKESIFHPDDIRFKFMFILIEPFAWRIDDNPSGQRRVCGVQTMGKDSFVFFWSSCAMWAGECAKLESGID